MTGDTTAGDARYHADIRWTTHGVPHITAADLGSLGFGQGWACAADHLPTIADQVLKVRSERAAFLGAGPDDRHVHSDLGYLALGVRQQAEHMAATQPPDVIDLVTGYAAGITAWLDEHGTATLPEWCRDAPWIRPVSALDLFTTFVDLALIASGRNLAEYVGAAIPPGADGSGRVPPAADGPLDGGLASNGWAFGRDATTSGRGMVMANPHFPWYGEARFWECHLQVPGELDVYGAALIGTPGVQIGFNEHVAWTHTFSAGSRFTVYKLDLVPGRPTAYRYGDDEREMTSSTFAVDVLDDDGTTRRVERDLWSSHHGLMVSIPIVGWSEAMGFCFRDANAGNDRMLSQVLATDRAASVAELRDAVASHQGMPWVNTIAADDTGACWYADASTTPALSEDAEARFEAALESDPLTQFAAGMRVALLDGSDPAFEWVDEPGAASPGTVPFDRLPQLERTDQVFNSNDPYWLAHPSEQLPRHATLCGLYRRPISPRSRVNALLVAGEGPVRPSGEGGRFTAGDVEEAVLSNHSLLAEHLLDGILERLADVTVVEVDGAEVDVAPAVVVLGAWDRRFDVDSVGAALWRELLAEFSVDELRGAGRLWAEGWSHDRPIHTPAGLAPAPDDGPDPLAVAAARAVRDLGAAGVPIDAPLGDVQWVERAGERIGVHGGFELEGIANVLSPNGTLPRSDLEPSMAMPEPVPGRSERTGLHQGGYPVTYGTSWLMIVEFTDDGPVGRGLLAYGQSGDPDAEHHSDQVGEYAAKRLRPLLLDDAAIAAATIRQRPVTG